MDAAASKARGLMESLADLRAVLERAADGDVHATLDANLVAPAIEPLARALNRLVERWREAQEDGRHSEARYRGLVEEGQAVVYVVDLHTGGAHIMMDDDMAAVLGYPRQEWQADMTLFMQRLHPEDRERVVAAKMQTLHQGEPLTIEYRMLSREGLTFWVHDHAVVEHDRHGVPIRLHGVALNITTRRFMEEALHESERRFERMADGLPHVIFRWGAEGLEYVSPACFQMLGRNPEELVACPDPRNVIIHPHDRARVPAIIADLEHGPVQLEIRLLRANGSPVWTEQRLLPILDRNGNLVAVEGAACDITDRKRMEIAVRESEELFHTLASLSPVGIFRTDAQGLCTYVNEYWRSLTGMSLAEALGDGWPRALHPDDRELVPAEWYRVVAARAPFLAEYRVQRPDGQITWVLGQAIAETNSAGTLRGYVGTITDITDRKQAELALQESAARYRNIFEHAAVSLWEEDFSALFQRLRQLREEGVIDIPAYLQEHPELVRWAVDSVKVLDVNQQSLDLFGAQSKEQLLAGLSQIFLPETFAVFANEVVAIAAGHTRFRAECPMQTLEGHRRDVLVSIAFPPEAGPWTPTLVSLIDITEHKQAEEALRRSELRYRSIFEGASVAIWEADYSVIAARLEALTRAGVRDFRAYFAAHPEVRQWENSILVLDVNEESLKLFGASSKAELLRSYRAAYLPEAIPLFMEALIALAEGQRTFEAEVSLPTARGERRDVLVSLAFPEPGASFKHALVCNTDITELKRVERALLDAEHGKREAARTAADVERRRLAHELHDGALQDLGAVKLLLEVERKRGRGAALGPALERIIAVMLELRAVVDNLRPPDLTQASFQEAIVAQATWLTSPNGIALTLELDPGVSIAPAGVRDLYRIAQEALSNAVRHGHPTRVAVRLRRCAQETVLEIADDGAGFDATAPQHGMGLHSMRERAAALSADLDISSAAGTGTCVRVVIPSGDSNAAAPAPQATGVTASRDGSR